jgi:glycine cleavage system H protein
MEILVTQGTSIPTDRRYSAEHGWVMIEDESVLVGITDFAQSELGDVVYVDLPAVGARLEAGKAFGMVESVKTASDLFAPIDGIITGINEALAEQPNLVNDSPYERGWMLRLAPEGPAALDSLLDADQYRALIEH